MRTVLEVKITDEVKQEAIVEHIRKVCELSWFTWELIEEENIVFDTFVFRLKDDSNIEKTVRVTITHDEAIEIVRSYIIAKHMPEGYTLTAEYPTLGEYTFEKED